MTPLKVVVISSQYYDAVEKRGYAEATKYWKTRKVRDGTCTFIGVSRNRNRVVPASYHNFSCKKWSYYEPAVNPSKSRLLWHFIL